MKKSLFAFILPLLLVFVGCSSPQSSAENHAEEICDCLKEIGVNKDLTIAKMQDREFMRDMEDKAERTLPAKMIKIMKAIEKDLSSLSKDDKKEYTRTFLKAIIDTDCADVLFENIPYDMMGIAIGEMEREMEYSNRNYDNFH
jgi:hypothetical protein